MEHTLRSVWREGQQPMETIFQTLIQRYHNFVFLGGPGAGKTELAVNLAFVLAQRQANVHFFDLDQTKPLFRARLVAEEMKQTEICVHVQEQFQDIPSMVPGIVESLENDAELTLLDVGGGVHGAFMAGQLSRAINSPDTCVFYVINVYRPWSDSAEGLLQTHGDITDACHVKTVHLISNPTLGPTTTAEEVIRGDRELDRLLGKEKTAEYLCVSEELVPLIEHQVNKEIIPIRPYISMKVGY